MNSKKFWLVKLRLFIDGYEKISKRLVEADDEGAAIEQAYRDESHNKAAEWSDEWQSFVDGDMAYRAEGCVEVPWDDAVVLRKYL